jgi:hypothetical protein
MLSAHFRHRGWRQWRKVVGEWNTGGGTARESAAGVRVGAQRATAAADSQSEAKLEPAPYLIEGLVDQVVRPKTMVWFILGTPMLKIVAW